MDQPDRSESIIREGSAPLPSHHLIRLFWTNFAQCDVDAEKLKWLELFIVEYNRVVASKSGITELGTHQYRFLATAASQLTCYLLQLVQAIIGSSVVRRSSAVETMSHAQLDGLERQQSPTPSMVKNNADITTIVALREFLMAGVGGRILEVLLTIDTKNMLCARELTGLLVTLFPSSSWELSAVVQSKENMNDLQSLEAALVRLESSIKQKAPRQPVNGHAGLNMSARDLLPKSSSWELDDELQLESFDDPETLHFTGDYIGSLVLNLINKLELEDSTITMSPDSGCVTTQCLSFALDTYEAMPGNTAFSPTHSHILHKRLLTIICGCISTKFAKNYPDSSIEIPKVLQKLLDAAEKSFGVVHGDPSALVQNHIKGLCMFVSLCMQKTSQHTDSELFSQLNDVVEQHSIFLSDMFAKLPSAQHNKPLVLLLKVIQSLRSNTLIDMPNKRHSSSRKRSQIISISYSQHHHHQQIHILACSLERIALGVAARLTNPANLRLIFRHFQLSTQCCCNIDITHLSDLLQNSRRTFTHKQCLHFIRHNILRTTFGTNTACTSCETRRNDIINGPVFYQLYTDPTTPIADLPSLLKHIAKIAKLLPFDMSCRIMIEVLLPPFRREKQHLTESSTSREIVSLCLNAFLCYLRDIRLIKGFFNDENLEHLSDLIGIPEFASLVCCLLKIALDNASFLGENCGEQLVLSQKLRQIRSRSVQMVSEVLARLFRSMDAVEDGRMQLKLVDVDDSDDTNELLNLLKAGHLSVYSIIQLGIVYWNMLLQMLRRTAESDASSNTPSTVVLSMSEYEELVCLVHNTLSCFMYSQPILEENDALGALASHFVWESMDDTPLATEHHMPNTIFNGEIDAIDGANSDTYQAGFSSSLVTSDPDRIYDLRLSKSDLNVTKPNNDCNIYQTIDNRVSTVDGGVINTLTRAPEEPIVAPSTVQNVLQFLNTNLLEVLFPVVPDSDDRCVNVDVQRDIVSVFGETSCVVEIVKSAEHKKLFLQLFEITCGVLMTADQQSTGPEELKPAGGKPSRMSSSANTPTPSHVRNPLHDLKAILLRHAERIHDSTQNGAAIISALQSLLKCAEMRYKCCIVEDCAHATYSRSTVTTVPGSTSTTISMKDGGDNQCCSSLLQNNNSFDGGGSGFEPCADGDGGSGNRFAGGRGSYSSDVDQTDAEQDEVDEDVAEWAVSSDDSFMTADEGYDGDAELAGSMCSEDDFDEDIVRSSQLPSSRYRSQIVHADICRIVIDILIELSKRCLDEPEFWPKYLLPIAVQLTAIRESIGGSLYLLKGFAALLECSDVRLKEFQKAILELVTDVSTPDLWSAYLSILASGDRPPVHLLLSRLIYLGTTTLRVHPKAQLMFPTLCADTSLSTTADPLVSKSIKEVRDFHIYHRLRTALTRSAYIVPLHNLDFRPWSPTGFTVAMWLNPLPNARLSGAASQSSGFGGSSVRSEPSMYSASASAPKPQTFACSAHCTWDEKTHLLSVGSNRLMLSIYLHTLDPSTMFFQLTKPNSPIIDRSKSNQMPRSHTADAISDPSTSPGKPPSSTSTTSCQCVWRRIRRTQQPTINKENADPIGLNVLSSTLKTTRIALRNSFSQFNLFSASALGHDSAEYQSQRYPLEVKGVRLMRNKWTHLAFSVIAVNKEMTIRITVDGVDQHDIHLPCVASPKYEKFQLMCIGDTIPTTDSMQPLDQLDGEQFGLQYSISNVQLFQRSLTQPQILSHMVALGPDVSSFVDCQFGDNIPNYGLLNAQKLGGISTTIDTYAAMKTLRDNVVATFSAANPTVVNGYNRIDGTKGVLIQVPVMAYSQGSQSMPIASLQTAVNLSGGISSLLYLFARVVELTEDDSLQAAALSFILRTMHTDSTLYTEFHRKDGMSMLGPVIKSNRCRKGVQLLNAIMDIACDHSVLTLRSDNQYHVNGVTSACLLHPDLLVSVIRRYSDWHTTTHPNPYVIETLLAALQSLVREKHPRQSVNIRRLNEVGLIPALLQFCKLYLVGIPNPVKISVRTADALVSLVGIFAGAPPPASLLDEVAKVLLLLHRPSDSFITHDRSKFYFLVTSTTLAKPKQRMSLPHLPTGRRLSLSVRKKNSTDSTITPMPTLNRSVSLKPTQMDQFETDEPPKRLIVTDCAASSRDESDGIDLESIADCSRVKSRQVLSSIGSVVVSGQQHFRNRSSPASKTRIAKRSTRRRRIRTGTAGRTASDSDTNVSESGFDEDMSGLVRQYDIIASEDIRCLEESLQRMKTASSPSELDGRIASVAPSTHEGVRAIQAGFFQLLKDFILVLPDSAIIEVLAHYVTVEVVLVLANHHDTVVRASVVRLLAHMCQRIGESKLALYQKQHYWMHLGNQIALHPVDAGLVQACCKWVTGGSCLAIEQMVVQPDLKITDKLGLHVLLAVLPQTTDDLFVLRPLLLFLDRLYSSVANADQRTYMFENGLVVALGKSMTRFFHNWGTPVLDNVVSSFQKLATSIGLKSLRGFSPMNILWDLLNTMTFIEDSRNTAILRGVRAIHAAVLYNLLVSFLPSQMISGSSVSVKLNVSEISLAFTALSSAEIKTRFELLTDRIVQFITTAEPSHQPTDDEFRLIETVVQLTVKGISRCANVIPWSLCPSRPLPLKLFTIHTLHRQTTSGSVPLQLCCDLKILKIMVAAFLATDSLIIPSDDQVVLQHLAHSLFIHIPSIVVANLSQTLEKIESLRQNSLRERKPAIDRTIFKYESIVQPCIDSAMKVTRSVVELQNAERRILMNEMRADDDSRLAIEWQQLIARMTHEGAPWHSARHYPRSWRLDETEGPSRSRMRLKRCHLDVADRFLMPDVVPPNGTPKYPLSYLQDSLVQRPHFPLNDQVLYTFACSYLPADVTFPGEMIVTETHLIFLSNDVNERPIQLNIAGITEIWLRRHQHRDTGLEFCMDSQRSVLFVFGEEAERAILIQFFADKVVQCPDESKLVVLTQHWTEGHLTNWEYLMALNQISGRTYQDLMQYPVFPWILADYESANLNLNDPSVFRRLDRPIAVQHKESETHYISNYNYLKQAQSELADTGNVKAVSHMTPYHYGSHYSNSGTVLHFLVRVPPFTNYFLRYQDNSFDLPDRTFHSIRTTWRLASRDSPTDVKELVPEFFTLPELLENFEQFRFGKRQSGERVDHVALPSWAGDSSRLFVLIHRQALESDAVRMHLHRWIDLVFGWKQTGTAAVEAINVFHPATYIGFSVSDGSDSVEKNAFETMVRTYGQMPRQLFHQPHPPAMVPVSSRSSGQCMQIASHVKGLRWGIFTGSPQLNDPHVVQHFTSSEHLQCHRIFTMSRTNVCYALPMACNVMQGNEPDTMNVVQWQQSDGIVRIRPMNNDWCSSNSNHSVSQLQPLLAATPDDPITCCGSDPNSDQLWFGYKSGRVVVHQWHTGVASQQKFNKSRFVQHSTSFNFSSYNSAFRKLTKDSSDTSPSTSSLVPSKWKEPIVLIRHTDEVSAIALSDEFKIAVTVGLDGIAAIWDTNTLEYVRSLARPSICPAAPIVLVTISPTLGDIVTVHSVNDMGDSIPITADDCLEATEEEEQMMRDNGLDEMEDFVAVPLNLGGSKCVMRLHTINAKYVCHLVDSDVIRCVAYSSVKEGTGVNVVATGYAAGIVRLWSGWDFTLVREIHPFGVDVGDVVSIVFSTYQHLVVLSSNNVIRVWQSDGLAGRPPKFPQICFQQKRKSV